MRGLINRKIKKSDILLYFLFIPFFFPRGFGEYFSMYKTFYTLWIYGSSVIILFKFIWLLGKNRLKINSYIKSLLLFHAYFIIDTIVLQKGIHEGLQKLFVIPILCLGCFIYLGTKPIKFLNCLSNILVIVFFLNLCVFNPILFSRYFSASNKLLFLGHVQMAGQIGMLGILISYLLMETSHYNKRKVKTLQLFSILTMVLSKTVLALICLSIFGIGTILRRIKSFGIIGRKRKLIFIFFFIFDFIVISYLYTHNWSFNRIGIVSTLHGRLAIWESIVELLKGHWIFGYGVYGYKILVYWSAWTKPEGIIYAHNQVFQLLLDGGLILLGLFIFMVYNYIKKLQLKQMSTRMRQVTSIVLISFLAIMFIESPTEYFYFFVVMSIFPFISKISNCYSFVLGE